MARTNQYRSETSKKCKPWFLTRQRKWSMFCDIVIRSTVILYLLLSVWNTSPINAKTVITGSGGYSTRRIHLDFSDGGYKGIVVKIDKEVPEKHCPKILSNIKVRKT